MIGNKHMPWPIPPKYRCKVTPKNKPSYIAKLTPDEIAYLRNYPPICEVIILKINKSKKSR